MLIKDPVSKRSTLTNTLFKIQQELGKIENNNINDNINDKSMWEHVI